MLKYKSLPVEAISHETSSKPAPAGSIEKLILLLFGIEGFISLVYEIVWMRILSASVLLNSVYSFTVVSATFIAGLALGGFIISRFLDKLRNLPTVFVIIEILTGISALVSLVIFKNSNYIISRLFSYTGGFWVKYIGAEIVFSFIIMIIPAVFMGIIFPLVSRIYLSNTEKPGSKMGLVGFYDTIGSVFGAFAAGFIFIQFFGMQSTVFIMAFLNLMLAFTVLLSVSVNLRKSLKIFTASFSLLLFILISVISFKDPMFWRKKSPTDELVFYEEDATATVTVTKRKTIEGETLFLRINGADVAGTDLMIQTTQKTQAHLPLLIYESLNAHAAARVLQIGFGSGGTSWSATLHNPVEMTCVELVPGIIHAAKKYFSEVNHNVFCRPLYKTVLEDGRNYLIRNTGTYDAILTESIHPIYAGNATLYSSDYFKLCRKRLSENGLVAVWLPMWKMSVEDFKTVLKTFQSVFPHSTIWYVTNCLNKQVHLIGTIKETRIETGSFMKNFEAVKSDLRSVNLDDPLKLMDSFLMSEDDVREYSSNARINSENMPCLEFSAPFSYDLDAQTWKDNLNCLLKYKRNAYGFFRDSTKNTVLEKNLKNYSDSSIHIIKGIVKHLDSDFKGSYYDFKKAALVNPEDKTTAYLIDTGGKIAVNQLISMGNNYTDEKLFEKAISCYKEALAIKPDDIYALNALGTVHFYNSSFPEAESIFLHIILKNPNHPEAYNGLGLLYMKTNLYSKAIDNFKKSVTLNPSDFIPHYSLSILYAETGCREEAVKELNEAMLINPESPQSYSFLAGIFKKNGMKEDAEKIHKK
jgi:predicted membrane-bound spermidine synthase/tetratricopeptide (TPR) repeat protein